MSLDIDLSKITLTEPKNISENSFEKGHGTKFTKSSIFYDATNIITLQTSKLEISSINGNDIELLIAAKEKNKQFYNFMTSIENQVTLICSQKSQEWFNKELSVHNIKSLYRSNITRPNNIENALTIKLTIPDHLKGSLTVGDIVSVSFKIDGINFSNYMCWLNIIVTDLKVFKASAVPVEPIVEPPVDVPTEPIVDIPVEAPAPVLRAEINYFGDWFPCKILSEENEKYTVEFNDGTIQKSVGKSFIRFSEVEHNVEPVVEPPVETPVEPVVEHKVEPVVEPPVEHKVEPVVEHKVEPHVEPVVVHKVEPQVVKPKLVQEFPDLINDQQSDPADPAESYVPSSKIVLPIHPSLIRNEKNNPITKLKNDINKAILEDNYELTFKLQALLKTLLH
jgi:Agenet domain